MATDYTIPQRKLTWFITGCSSGFGLSLTRTVQANGHTVIATSRDPSRTPSLVAEIESKGGKWLQLDVNDLHSSKVIQNLEASGQEIDVLVNNAGFSLYAPMETFTEAEIRAQMETLYFGPLRLIKAVLPFMRKRRSGTIVNFSSGASLDGLFTMGAYAGAKAALDGMSKVMAKEIAPFKIRVLTVILGTFNTNFSNVAQLGKEPIPDDYKNTAVGQVLPYFDGTKVLPPNGDKEKAMRVVYEVVVGEGVGAGREAETFLPLGPDMVARVRLVQDNMAHGLEAFEDVAKSVRLEK